MPMMFLGNGYHGADQSDSRGYVYWPQLDTRKTMTAYTRTELLRRSRAFEGNSGVARKCIRGLSRKIGYLLPQPATRDPEWNRKAHAAFLRRATSADVFDMSGKLDFLEAQICLMQRRIRDGEWLTVKVLSPAGRARFAFYEAQQIRQPENPGAAWQEGVYLDRSRRIAAFHVQDPGEKTGGEIYLASQAIYVGHFENHGQARGSSELVAALNHIQDRAEIEAAWKKNIKISSVAGVVRTRDGLGKEPGGLLGSARRSVIQTPGTTGDVNNPTSANLSWEMVMGSGVIPNLGPGEDLKILHDDRPAPAQMEFLRHIVRDIAWSLDFNDAALWDISELTGPGVRYAMADVREWILHRQRILAGWCRKVYAHVIAAEMATGNLQPCRDPEWWQVDWRGPADATIDKGRDGALAMNMLDKGMTTLQDWYHSTEGAVDWRNKITDRVTETKHQLDECKRLGVPYEIAFPRAAGAAPMQGSPDSPGTTDDPPDDDDPDADPATPPDSRLRRAV